MHVCLLIVCSLLPSQSLTQWPVTGDIQPVSDPAIIQCGGKSYIYCSGRGIPVRVSSDLHHWERLAPVFAEVPQWARDRIPTAHHFWAPDISVRDGKLLALLRRLNAREPEFRDRSGDECHAGSANPALQLDRPGARLGNI